LKASEESGQVEPHSKNGRNSWQRECFSIKFRELHHYVFAYQKSDIWKQ
jgi:hypothetical protein